MVKNILSADPFQIANEFNEYFSTVADNLQAKIYHTGSDFSRYLTNMHNFSFFIKPTNQLEIIASYFDKLKVSKTIPVYNDKGDVLDSSNYRAISLLSNINKIVEKLMYERLYSFLTIHKCIYFNQLGFRKNHSTIHALLGLLE